MSPRLPRSVAALALLLAACTGGSVSIDKESAEKESPGGESGPTDSHADSSGIEDADQDGYPASEDCNDHNEDVHPGATEVCDERDNDCDGEIDEADAADAATWYRDADGDGYGATADTTTACDEPEGYAALDGDCADDDTAYHPGAPETDCTDPADYNCDGSVGFADADGDGFAACEDCDDADPAIYPGALELCNGLDDDCDGEADGGESSGTLTWYADADGDGFGDPGVPAEACVAPSGYVGDATDCDDANAAVHPGAAEICDDLDNDCDGKVDDDDDSVTGASTWYYDADGDGYGSASFVETACDQPAGWSGTVGDCDDANPDIHPGADETCNAKDDDCDGDVDEDPVDGALYAADEDGDGFGDAGSRGILCSGVDNELDCDDGDASEPVVVDAAHGSSSGAGTSASPLDTISDAVTMASRCVVVYPGTYEEAVDLAGKNLVISSTEGSGATIVDASGLDEAVVNVADHEDAELHGFTLTGGGGHLTQSSTDYSCGSGCDGYHYYDTWCGGAIHADGASLVLDDVVMADNVLPENGLTVSGYDDTTTYSFGGGICASDTVIVATGVTIDGNYAYDGGGVYAYAGTVASFDRAVLAENSAEDGAGVEIDGASVSLTNALVVWNVAGSVGGGAMVTDGSITLTNVTLDRNAANTGGGVDVETLGTASIDASLITNSPTGVGVVVSAGSVAISYSDVYGNTDGAYSGMTDATGTRGNLGVDPLYTSVSDDGVWTDDDWSLTSTSPAIDAGDPAAALDDADGSTNDMGAFGGPGSGWTY